MAEKDGDPQARQCERQKQAVFIDEPSNRQPVDREAGALPERERAPIGQKPKRQDKKQIGRRVRPYLKRVKRPSDALLQALHQYMIVNCRGAPFRCEFGRYPKGDEIRPWVTLATEHNPSWNLIKNGHTEQSGEHHEEDRRVDTEPRAVKP